MIRCIGSAPSLRTCAENLTDRQQTRLPRAIEADERHDEVYVAWQCAQQLRSVYHQMNVAPGLSMRHGVRMRGRVHRRDLNGEVFDGRTHDMRAVWEPGGGSWRFELANARRVGGAPFHLEYVVTGALVRNSGGLLPDPFEDERCRARRTTTPYLDTNRSQPSRFVES